MIYDTTKVKQLKLVTGDEVLCEIIEEDDDDIVIRNALSIQFHMLDDASRIWTFRYFMTYQDDPELFILLKVDKIVGVANPIPALVEQYIGALTTMMDNKEEDLDPFDMNFEMKDSDDTNILQFPTVH